MDTSRALPDPENFLRDSSDFILNSSLGRKALCSMLYPGLSVFLRDLLTAIHRLVVSCHLPEFTNHGLSHLCNLVDRISKWNCATTEGKSNDLLDQMNNDEALVLLVAILIHDIGMLSQKPEDLEEGHPMLFEKGRMDISGWVRKTHVNRIDKLVKRLFNSKNAYEEFLKTSSFQSAIRIAKVHNQWPWDEGYKNITDREQGLAAIVAVSDLLDEDSSRCDSTTLIKHREGTTQNKAHWIRHTLTRGQVKISKGEIYVCLLRPPGTDARMLSFFNALRNHYRLVLLYNEPLRALGAGILNIKIDPPTGCPVDEADNLHDWESIPGFQTQKALKFHLLRTLFPESLLDSHRVFSDILLTLRSHGFEEVDLEEYYQIIGETEVRSPYEQEFLALT